MGIKKGEKLIWQEPSSGAEFAVEAAADEFDGAVQVSTKEPSPPVHLTNFVWTLPPRAEANFAENRVRRVVVAGLAPSLPDMLVCATAAVT